MINPFKPYIIEFMPCSKVSLSIFGSKKKNDFFRIYYITPKVCSNKNKNPINPFNVYIGIVKPCRKVDFFIAMVSMVKKKKRPKNGSFSQFHFFSNSEQAKVSKILQNPPPPTHPPTIPHHITLRTSTLRASPPQYGRFFFCTLKLHWSFHRLFGDPKQTFQQDNMEPLFNNPPFWERTGIKKLEKR